MPHRVSAIGSVGGAKTGADDAGRLEGPANAAGFTFTRDALFRSPGIDPSGKSNLWSVTMRGSASLLRRFRCAVSR